MGELVKKGVAGSWVNPAYWNRQYVTASHIANNVPNGSAVIELGKDAKNLYYLNSPGACTLIIPPANEDVKEGPIREAAAKLNVPFVLYTDQPLDTIPIRTSACDAALCFDMLDGAPEEACAGAIALLARSLKPGGRLLFLERETVGLPQLMREYDFGDRLEVDFENEGGYDVGVATRRVVGRPSRKAAAKPGAKKKGGARVIPEAALKGGFGATVPPKKASGEAKAAQKQEWAAAKEKAKAERAAARAAEEERVTAERAVAQERAAAEERVVAERAAAEKAAAEKVAAEKAAAEKAAAEKAADDIAAAEKVAAEAAAEKAVAEKRALEQAVAAQAAAMAAAQKAAAEETAAEQAASAAAAAEQAVTAATAAAGATTVKKGAGVDPERVRSLLRREVVYDKELSAEESAWLEAMWDEDGELCDRIDDEVAAEKAAADAVAGQPMPPPETMPLPQVMPPFEAGASAELMALQRQVAEQAARVAALKAELEQDAEQ